MGVAQVLVELLAFVPGGGASGTVSVADMPTGVLYL